MPALRGSLTYARFYVDGEVADDFREKFMRSIRLRSMKPLEAEDEDLERSGWCKVGEPFELELGYEDVFYNEYLNLGFRTDKWRLPASVLKQRLREAEAAYLEKKGRERLGRAEKTELKEIVSRKLKKQSSPSTRLVDLSWSMNEGIVRFFSHADKTAGAMMELFYKTFGLRLVAESPYTLASRFGLSKPQEAAWQDLEVVMLETQIAMEA